VQFHCVETFGGGVKGVNLLTGFRLEYDVGLTESFAINVRADPELRDRYGLMTPLV